MVLKLPSECVTNGLFWEPAKPTNNLNGYKPNHQWNFQANTSTEQLNKNCHKGISASLEFYFYTVFPMFYLLTILELTIIQIAHDASPCWHDNQSTTRSCSSSWVYFCSFLRCWIWLVVTYGIQQVKQSTPYQPTSAVPVWVAIVLSVFYATFDSRINPPTRTTTPTTRNIGGSWSRILWMQSTSIARSVSILAKGFVPTNL